MFYAKIVNDFQPLTIFQKGPWSIFQRILSTSLNLQIITLKLQIHSEYEKYVVKKLVSKTYPGGIYLFKVTIETPEQCVKYA